ncbi:unnamed protein product [Staurois parvus]|uniref:Uncharacterized protein n=1 Tax=Staurois parvus TaxID=386267 RepID=A0ABN9EU13_9NEOB|nr:unnamed protein product [Staurois parvus]
MYCLTFGGYLYCPEHLGDICTVLTFGGYLYCPDIWGISVPFDIWGISVLSLHLEDICTVPDIWGISVCS